MELTEFRLDAYDISAEEVLKYFNKRLIEWNKSDFEKFAQAFTDCREQNYFKNYDKNYFSRVIKKSITRIKQVQENERVLLALEKAVKKAKVAANEEAVRKKQELLASIEKKYANTGPEDGWKNLKWGMTLEEIKMLYIDETGKECNKWKVGDSFYLSTGPFYYDVDKSVESSKLPATVSVLLCEMDSYSATNTGILLYNGFFFGKIVYIDNFRDKQVQDTILSQLKEKFPKGKVSQREGHVGVAGGRTMKYMYPSFQYTSDHIKVFTDEHKICFFEPKKLDAVISEVLGKKQQEEKQKQDKLKKLF